MAGNWWKRKIGWRWTIAGSTAMIIAVAGIAWWMLGSRFYTDGQTIRVAGGDARLREFLWTEPAPLEHRTEGRQEYEPAISPDGQELLFVRGKPGENADIYVCRRRNVGWSAPVPLVGVNSKYDELGPCVSPDGRWLLFYSDRPGGLGQYDLWAAQRKDNGWGAPINLGASINGPFNDYGPSLSPDGARLFYASNRKAAAKAGGEAWRATIRQAEIGNYDLYSAELVDSETGIPAFKPAGELDSINTPYHEGSCAVSPAGDFLYFASNRPGGVGGFDLYRVRLYRGKVFGLAEVERLGGEINTPRNETDPHLADGGFRLYFSSDRDSDSVYRLYSAESREVYAFREPRELPAIGWAWWLLLIGLALLVPLLLLMRRIDPKRLSLLQRCLLASLLLHILLTLVLSVTQVTRDIIAFVAQRTGDQMTVNLSSGKEAEIALQVRSQVTTLATPAPPPAAMEQLQASRLAVAPPRPADVQTPQLELRPSVMEVRPPQLPLQAPAAIARSPVETPPLSPVAPAVKIEAPRPVTSAEPQLRPTTANPRELSPQAVAAVEGKAAPVSAEAGPVQVVVTSLAQPAEITPAELPAPQPIARQASVEVVSRPVEVAEPSRPRPLITSGPDAPRVAEAHVPSEQQATAMPSTQPSRIHVAIPGSEPGRQSMAQAAPVMPRAAPAAQPVVPEATVVAAAIEVASPVPAAPKVAAVELESPRVEAGEPRPLEALPMASSGPVSPMGRIDARVVPLPPTDLGRTILSPTVGAMPIQPAALSAISPDIGPGINPAPHWTGPMGVALPENLSQRSLEMRQRLLEELGGSTESEDAVSRALTYLSRQQEPDGRWTKIENSVRSGKRARDRHDSALTSLTTLAFLASDHTPNKEGPYQQTVVKALDHLLSLHKGDGDLRGGGDMYDQAITTIALAEAAIMTGDRRYREAAIAGARFITRAIDRQTGGWRYTPGQAGDTSVVGWQLMALRSAQHLGAPISAEVREHALRFLKNVSSGEHGMLARYQPGQPVLHSMTAEAAFCRTILGQRLTDGQVAEASNYILSNLPGKGDQNYYYWYYASLTLVQFRGEAWSQWNEHMRKELMRLQRRGGEDDGSWDYDKSRHGNRNGRVYSTAIAALTLEVYYRYLPAYARPTVGEPGR